MAKENEIAGLLSQGIAPAELVRKGYARGTVYKVRRRLEQPGTAQENGETPAVADPELDPALEADPEIMELKKAIRKTELEQQLADLQAPTRFEPRLSTVEKTVSSVTTTVKGMLEDVEDLRQQVEGSPVSGLREKFRCSCGQTGFVAVHVRCTSCRAETTYGWQPE